MISLQQIYQSSQTQRNKMTQLSQSNDSTTSATDAINDSLGKDQFLNLLVTQLQHQNPLEPMDNKNFISQMAQFSSLEQMNNLTSTMGDFVKFQKISQAGSLVGKKVRILNSNSGQVITGKIEKASVTGETTEVTVNGRQYPIANIQEIIAGE